MFKAPDDALLEYCGCGYTEMTLSVWSDNYLKSQMTAIQTQWDSIFKNHLYWENTHMLCTCTSSTTYTWQWHYHNDSWRNSTYRAAWPDKVELWRWVWSLCSSYGMLQRNLCEFSWLLHEHSHWGAFHEHILWFVNNQNWGLCKTRLYEWRCSHSWQFMNGHELSWMTFMTMGGTRSRSKNL